MLYSGLQALLSLTHFSETGCIDIKWDATDQEGQGSSGKQAGWPDQQSFRLDAMGEWAVHPSDGEEPRNIATVGSNGGKLQICSRGIWDGSPKRVTQLIAWLKCLCTNACSTWNKQEEMGTSYKSMTYLLTQVRSRTNCTTGIIW